ncbi:hypothetical protein KQH60_08120 [Mycetohabitans sp. B8]|uniref:DUF5681 domain-containing protein n=1 Tax=Mycetohabitans sp. B8 TaxID=2841845 RepID=UPI001F35556A|nr:DUF5681 domain-containing protein [Mycetohabitans sp. B8]MCG1042512.1 hypothetical protein [Mycetohabitans sp. B8]
MALNSARTAKKQRGKPFVKGQTGNPKGRPKRTKEELDLIAACKAKTPDALEVIESIMVGGENERIRLSAALAIIERGYGKPVQGVELGGTGGGPVDWNFQVTFVRPQ